MLRILKGLVVGAVSISCSWQWNLTVQAICVYANPSCSMEHKELTREERRAYIAARLQTAIVFTIFAALVLAALEAPAAAAAAGPTPSEL